MGHTSNEAEKRPWFWKEGGPQVTTIKVTCPDCGDIDLRPGDLELNVAPTWATYSFMCAECGESVCKAADMEIVDLLSSAGVRSVVIPAEVFEERSGSAIGYDDLLDFGLALQDDDSLHEALMVLPRGESASRRKRRLRW